MFKILTISFVNYWVQSIDFLSTVIDDQKVTAMLIEPLIKVGLVDHAISLLTTEIEKLSDESKLDRYGEYYFFSFSIKLSITHFELFWFWALLSFHYVF